MSARHSGLRRSILLLVLLASLFVIVVTGYHWWLSSRVQSRLAQVRAEHEPVTLPELNRYYAEVPEPSNAAVAYGRAFGLLQKTKSFQTLEHVYELPSGSGPLPADARQVMEKACQENAETFGALSEGNKLKSCRYPVDYTPGWAALLPHLRHLTKCSALEMYRGVLGEQKGNVQEAIESIETIVQLSASLDSEPDLISMLIRHRLYFHASELLKWLLNHRQLSGPQLTKLQDIFESTRRTNTLERALIGERCMILAVFDYSPGEILNVIDPGYENRVGGVFGIYVLQISGALKKDKLQFLERVDECRAALRLPLLAGLDRAEELRSGMSHEARPKKFILTGVLLPSFLKGFERNAESIARQRLVQIALALEQYRLARTHLPSSLTELSPQFLSRVPTDPFSNEEMRFRTEGNGYVLYSIGPDRRDDGGAKEISRESKTEQRTGDIIFTVSR